MIVIISIGSVRKTHFFYAFPRFTKWNARKIANAFRNFSGIDVDPDLIKEKQLVPSQDELNLIWGVNEDRRDRIDDQNHHVDRCKMRMIIKLQLIQLLKLLITFKSKTVVTEHMKRVQPMIIVK